MIYNVYFNIRDWSNAAFDRYYRLTPSQLLIQIGSIVSDKPLKFDESETIIPMFGGLYKLEGVKREPIWLSITGSEMNLTASQCEVDPDNFTGSVNATYLGGFPASAFIKTGDTASYATSASWAPPTPSDSASYAVFAETAFSATSASYAPQLDLSGYQPIIAVGSTLQITASVANYANYAPVDTAYSASVVTQLAGKQSTLTNTVYAITASMATSASWAPMPVIPSTDSSSWASSSISASFAQVAAIAVHAQLATMAETAESTLNAETASLANVALNAQDIYIPDWSSGNQVLVMADDGYLDIPTEGVEYPITVSNAVSASWAPGGAGVVEGGSYNITCSNVVGNVVLYDNLGNKWSLQLINDGSDSLNVQFIGPL